VAPLAAERHDVRRTSAGGSLFAAALIISVAFSAGTQSSGRDVPSPEREALMDLFAATGGGGWVRRDGWGTRQPVCEWAGVWCDFIDGDANRPVVASLSLRSNNLRGVLPGSLSSLQHLTSLDVSANHLSGELPEPLLDRWDKHQLWLDAAGSTFQNVVTRAIVEYSASGTLCAMDDDVRFRLEVDVTKAVFESVRCADIESRRTYCLVREGTPGSLGRLSRALRALGFAKFRPAYDYPSGSHTHDIFLTTTAEWGDGVTKAVETYGRQGPLEVWMAQQLFLGLLHETSWTRESRKARCRFEQ
jgi:hypothetical protein